ncbi:MAG: type II toxin-antitoxin system RelE/ParE family toxin [Magnetococcales bacterium]|nr:type II toxin-antitoxin system RelE/ParE family toxin [Magnetococcales bacterium]
MRVRWTKRAEYRLYDGTKYIRKENPEAAKKVITAIRRVVDKIAEHPYLSPQSRAFSGFREAVVPRYPFVIWYRVKEDEQIVEILTIWHTSQDRFR